MCERRKRDKNGSMLRMQQAVLKGVLSLNQAVLETQE